MTDTDHVLEGYDHLSLAVAAQDIGVGDRQPGPEVPFWYLSSLLEDDKGSWGQPRPPLRRPFKMRTDLTIGQAPCPAEKTPRGCEQLEGSCLSQHMPSEESPAEAQVNSSLGLAGWGQMGPAAVRALQEYYARPTLNARGALIRGGATKSGAGLGVPMPRGHGGFVPGAQVTGPVYSPTIRHARVAWSPETWRRNGLCGKMGTNFFPTGRPERFLENWRRPEPFPPRVAGCPLPPAVPTKPFRPAASTPFPSYQLPFPKNTTS